MSLESECHCFLPKNRVPASQCRPQHPFPSDRKRNYSSKHIRKRFPSYVKQHNNAHKSKRKCSNKIQDKRYEGVKNNHWIADNKKLIYEDNQSQSISIHQRPTQRKKPI